MEAIVHAANQCEYLEIGHLQQNTALEVWQVAMKNIHMYEELCIIHLFSVYFTFETTTWHKILREN